MYPILFRIGSTPFYTYTAAAYAGALCALLLVLGLAPRRGLRPEGVTRAAIWSLAGAIIAGRLMHVALNWAGYSAQPSAIWQDWGEGMALPGALFGGLAGLAGYAVWHGEDLWRLGDLGALGLSLAQVWGWFGALMHGAQYGRAVYDGWAWELPDLHGIVLPRFPTQAVGLASGLVILAVLWALRRRFRPGGLLACYLALHGLSQALLQQTRGDEGGQGGLMLAAYLAEAGAALLIWFWTQRRDAQAARPAPLVERDRYPSEGS